MRNKIVLIGLSVLAVFAIACGVDSGDTDSSVGGDPQGGDIATDDQIGGPVTAAIGQTVTLTNTLFDSTDAVEITLADAQQHAEDPGAYGFGAPDNGVYLVVNVTVVCTQGTYFASSFNFTFVAADGTVYDTALVLGFEPQLQTIDLSSGQRTAGSIAFDVPPAALTGGRIQVDGIGLDSTEPAAYWAL
jgi:hypothetical protein